MLFRQGALAKTSRTSGLNGISETMRRLEASHSTLSTRIRRPARSVPMSCDIMSKRSENNNGTRTPGMAASAR